MPDVSRRAVARGAIWSVPVLAVGASAPAVAASCVPTMKATAARSVGVQWAAALLEFTSSDGSEGNQGSDIRRIRYTFTNNGPDAIPAGIKVDLRYVVTVDSTDWSSTLAVESASSNAQATATGTDEKDDVTGQITYRFHVTITTAQGVAKDDQFTVDLRFMYGLLAGPSGDLGHPEESVSMEPTQTVTNTATCVTTIVEGAVDGNDDTTVWDYPIS